MTTLGNPPVPPGYQLLKQAAVTPELTAWAVKILHAPTAYPLFATATMTVAGLDLLARVEWHPPDFQNHAVHRGVTLYGRPAAQADADAEGIDVSHYQATIDWPNVTQSGVHFAFIKATESTAFVDPSFKRHWAQAKQAGVLRGAYHFFRPQQDAATQARHFLAQLNDRGELPPVLDVEVADGVSRAAIVAGINTWLDIVTTSARRPIIYTSPAFWNSLPAMPSIAARADLWVAHLNAAKPAAVSGWQEWTFWQWTNKGRVGAVEGAAGVDGDRFNGTAEQLREYGAAWGDRRTA
jgi:GH25 family lysozyme M1 (1,4-beta-N-acetylmuramidase)